MELLKNVFSFEEAYKIEDYPYGFRLRTTKYIWLEKSNRGYRLVEQTINPKTGKLNKPKKTTYKTYIRLCKDDNGHIKIYSYNQYGLDTFYKAKELGIFETEEIEKELGLILRITTIKAMAIYSGFDFEKIKDLTLDQLYEIDKNEELALEYKTEEGKDPNYSPFVVRSHGEM